MLSLIPQHSAPDRYTLHYAGHISSFPLVLLTLYLNLTLYLCPQVNISFWHVLYCLCFNSTLSLVAVPTLTFPSSPPSPHSLYLFSLSSLFTSTLLLTCSLHPCPCHPALHLLSLLPSLIPSSLPLIQSRSSTSQIDFAAVLRSPINSQIGFPAYPLPLALCISFFLSPCYFHFSLSSWCSLSLPSVSHLSPDTLPPPVCYAVSPSFSHMFPLFLSPYTHSYLSVTAQVSCY